MGEGLLRLSETPLHEEREWSSDGITVLTAEVTLPRCEGRSRAARRFNRFYCRYAGAYLGYCAAELVPRAEERMRTALARSAPWERSRAVLDYTVTLARGDVLSLYSEGREENLPPRLTLRRAETWDLRAGLLLPLTDFFPQGTAVKKRLVLCAREAAAERLAEGKTAYASGYRAMLRRAFSARNFYLTPTGLHWFYPMYTLASAAEGIPDFFLPCGAHGFFLPPEG